MLVSKRRRYTSSPAEESLNASRNQIASLSASKSELEDRLAAATRSQELNEARWRDQLPLQERRATQVASQADQLRALKEENATLAQDKLRLSTQVSNLESDALTNKYELSLAQKEVTSLRRQLEQVHADLRDKSSAWREEKSVASREKLDLERQLVTAGDELASAQAAAAFANRALEDRDKLVKRLQAQVDSLQVGQRAIGDSAKNSQFAQLAELYKSKFEQCDAQRERLRAELQKKSDELHVKTAEAREMTNKYEQEKETTRQLQIEVANLASDVPDNLILSKEKLLNVIHQFMDEGRSKRRNVAKPKSSHTFTAPSSSAPITIDLDDNDTDNIIEASMDVAGGHETDDQLSVGSSASPTKDSTSDLEVARLLQSAAESENLHMLISLQQQYELATAQLVKQRSENRQLEEYFVRIEDEMKRTEPLMAEKQRKYESALAELADVKSQLTKATTRLQTREHEAAQNQRTIASLQQQVKQTSSQIQTLLYQAQNGNNAANTSMADIASLHNRNVDLEIMTRDMQTQLEALETELGSKNSELQAMVARYEQMSEIVSSLETTITAQEAIQSLSTKARSRRRESMISGAHSNANVSHATDLDHSEQHFEEGEDSSIAVNLSQDNLGNSVMFMDDSASKDADSTRSLLPFNVEDSPKYQHALLRIEELQRFAEELAKERDTWRDSTQKLHNTLSSKEAELERHASRSSILQATHSIHEEQIEDLRNKSQRLSELVARYEAQVSELNLARSNAVSEASTSGQLLEVGKMQVQLYKEQLDETKLALAQAREQWQTAQNHFRESSALHHRQEQHWIDVGAQQEARLNAAQKALEDAERDADAKISNLQETLATLRAEHASAQDKVSHLEEIVALKDQSLAQLKEVLEENKSIIVTLKKRAPAVEASPSPEPVINIDSEVVTELKMSLEEKNEELRIANEHLKSKTELLASLETRLSQLQTSYSTLTEESQASLAEFEAEIVSLQEQLKQRSESESSLREKHDTLVAQHNEVASQFEALKITHETVFEECENLRRERDGLKLDSQTLETTLKSTRANYQHQVTELSNTLSQLEALQKKNEKVTQERDQLLNKLQTSQQNLQTQKAQFDIKTTSHRSEVESLQQRIQDGVNNLASLSAELGMLKSQLSYWKTLSGGQASSATPNDNDINLAIHSQAADSFEVPEHETNTLQWLQREWQIALSNLSISQSENEELRAQIQHQRDNNERLSSENRTLREGSSENTNKEFTNASTPSGVTLQQQQAYEKLQAQTEQLNLLRESNIVLRQQRESSDKDNHELRLALANLQEDRDSLQTQVTRLAHEKNTAISNVQVLSQQNEQWKGRIQELLTKYKDIETHAAQESKIHELTEEVERLTNEAADMQARLDELNAELQDAIATSSKVVEERIALQHLLDEANNTVIEKATYCDEVEAQRAALESEVERLKAESEEYKEQLEEYVDEIAKLEDKEKIALKAADEAKKALAKSGSSIAASTPVPSTPKQTAAASVAPPSTPKAAPPSTPKAAPPAKSTTSTPVAAPKKAPSTPSAATAAPVSVASATTVAAPPSTPARASTPSPAVSTPAKATTAAAAPVSAPASSPAAKKPESVLPAMEAHLGQLKTRLGALETAKAAKESAAAASVAAPASDSPAMQVDTPAVVAKASTASTPAAAPPAAGTSKLPPPPPKAPAKAPTPPPTAPATSTTTTSATTSEQPTAATASDSTSSASTSAAPAKRLPPPPPSSAKNAKRNFSQMSTEAPAYVPSAPTTPNPSDSAPASPAPPASPVPSTTQEATSEPARKIVVSPPAAPAKTPPPPPKTSEPAAAASTAASTTAAPAATPATATTTNTTSTGTLPPPPPAKRSLPPPPKKTASPAPPAAAPSAASPSTTTVSSPAKPTTPPAAAVADPHSEDAPASKRPRFAEAEAEPSAPIVTEPSTTPNPTDSGTGMSVDEQPTASNVVVEDVAPSAEVPITATSPNVIEEPSAVAVEPTTDAAETASHDGGMDVDLVTGEWSAADDTGTVDPDAWNIFQSSHDSHDEEETGDEHMAEDEEHGEIEEEAAEHDEHIAEAEEHEEGEEHAEEFSNHHEEDEEHAETDDFEHGEEIDDFDGDAAGEPHSTTSSNKNVEGYFDDAEAELEAQEEAFEDEAAEEDDNILYVDAEAEDQHAEPADDDELPPYEEEGEGEGQLPDPNAPESQW